MPNFALQRTAAAPSARVAGGFERTVRSTRTPEAVGDLRLLGDHHARMETQRIKVMDGPLPQGIWERPDMEPLLVTAPEHLEVMYELMQREPLFHRPEFGMTRQDFEKMTAPGFWEIGASGRRYSRQFVLDVLEERYQKPTEAVWEMGDFHCLEIATDNYLVSYTLFQGERVTRRTTIWRRSTEGWQILFHQGTVVT